MEADELDRLLSIHRGHAALRHLFAVASALDSQVLGEPQVLGQLKDSHRVAQEAGLVAGPLEQMLQHAYTVAKRVRSETALASQPVSIAAAAVKVARQVHGDLRRCNALLLGLGEMGELMATQLRESQVARLVIAHPTHRRAETAARRLGCDVRPWEELDDALAEADVVVAGLGRGAYVIRQQTARRVLKRRRQRPIFVMDAAVPGDVEPAVHELDSAFVYDLGDLERVAQEGRAQREQAARDAWAILDAELDAFTRREQGREAAGPATALRQHFEAVRQEVLSTGKLDAEAATRLLVNRLLHEPTQALRDSAGEPADRAELERSLKRLFGVDPRGPGAAGRDREDNGEG
jgi:glutamyl-tRNA reductase